MPQGLITIMEDWAFLTQVEPFEQLFNFIGPVPDKYYSGVLKMKFNRIIQNIINTLVLLLNIWMIPCVFVNPLSQRTADYNPTSC